MNWFTDAISAVSSATAVIGRGAGPCAYRCAPLEAALARQWSADSARAVQLDPAGLNSDLHASSEYRAHLIPVLAGRAVAAAG